MFQNKKYWNEKKLFLVQEKYGIFFSKIILPEDIQISNTTVNMIPIGSVFQDLWGRNIFYGTLEPSTLCPPFPYLQICLCLFHHTLHIGFIPECNKALCLFFIRNRHSIFLHAQSINGPKSQPLN